MQPMKHIRQWLSTNTDESRYLFTFRDLRPLCLKLSDAAFKVLLSRAVSSGLLTRVCRGIYLFKEKYPKDGLILYRIAALLRADTFNYISLETALSDAGIISQIPSNWISIMSSGRSSKISCGDFGTIEFIHTQQKPSTLIPELTYDSSCGLWRASVDLALRDMKRAHRNFDLVEEE